MISCLSLYAVALFIFTAGLAGSRVQGTLPSSLAQLRALQVVDAPGTGVAGSLPDSWQQLSALQQIRLAGNGLQGLLPASWASLGNLTML